MPDKESLLESYWTEIQKPPTNISSKQKREGVSRRRKLLAVLIGIGILLTLILLLIGSYLMHFYLNENPQNTIHESFNPICSLPRLTGKCRANLQRWGWNPQTGTCQSFIYGGCDANENNFSTKKECEKVCQSRIHV